MGYRELNQGPSGGWPSARKTPYCCVTLRPLNSLLFTHFYPTYSYQWFRKYWWFCTKNCNFDFDIVLIILPTSSSFLLYFPPPGFSLEYTLHIYGDSEREGRLLPGSAQRFRWQVSLGFLCAIVKHCLEDSGHRDWPQNQLAFFFLIASIFLLMTPVKLSIK